MRYLLHAMAALAVSILPLSRAMADPIYGLPIDLLGATFGDGTALTGDFTLDSYGYVEQGSFITTFGGTALDTTPIPATAFVKTATQDGIDSLAADVIVANADVGGVGYSLILTFDHSLGTPGADSFVLDAAYSGSPNSAECGPWSCGDSSKERLVATGEAFVPEPVSATLLGSGLLGVLAARRRRA